MAIVRSDFGASSPESSEEMSPETSSGAAAAVSEEDELDTGMESEELDATDCGEAGTELCQVGDSSFAVPVDLFDLSGLGEVLNMDSWNTLLSEEERLTLSAFLPDMDRETFAKTLVELFSGINFHFGNPMATLFDRLKGRLFDPRIAAYRSSLKVFERRKHYCQIRKYHNAMVRKILRIKDLWEKCREDTLHERLAALHTLRKEHSSDGITGSVDTDTESRKEVVQRAKSKGVIKGSKGIASDSEVMPTVSYAGGYDDTDGLGMYYAGHIGGAAHSSGKSVRADQTVCVASYQNQYMETSNKQLNEDCLPRSRTLQFDPIKLEMALDTEAVPRRGKSKAVVDSNSRLSRRERMDDANLGTSSMLQGKGKKFGAPPSIMSMRGDRMYGQSEKIESVSSDKVNNAEQGYTGSTRKDYQHRGEFLDSNCNSMNSSKNAKANKSSSGPLVASDSCYVKGKHKGKSGELGYMYNSPLMVTEQFVHTIDNSRPHVVTNSSADRKRKKMMDNDLRDYGNNITYEGSVAPFEMPVQRAEIYEGENHTFDGINGTLTSCSAMLKKSKSKVDPMDMERLNGPLQPSWMPAVEETAVPRKKIKKKVDVVDPVGIFGAGHIVTEKYPAVVIEPEKPKKKPTPLITPTIHTGFSFSIIHLLSAVRKAMVCPIEDGGMPERPADVDPTKSKMEDQDQNQARQTLITVQQAEFSTVACESTIGNTVQCNLPALTVQEVVNRLRLNPGDPCILETQEPLVDLVRGALKILSSKTAPLGAKAWKPLVERSYKTWFWVGPPTPAPVDDDPVEETSADAWAINHKTLVKLVDAFANWLKSSQETLKQIGSLPPPPQSLLSLNLDEKERFKDLRAQKSSITITPSSDEVRSYFRREELLRYSIPDRAFLYTAADGKKSIVAPQRRGGGKPTSKARDHFMLKPDRPPHVTILCLVRDAAARLPGSIGTRADVCTLIRDSQYIVEDVSDTQINAVVSGALDRLHYERDPCVQYDADRKLWVYLHREREEEDFEDDGTSSTKKWKRPKKDGADGLDNVEGNDAADIATGDPSLDVLSGVHNFDLELNVDASSVKVDAKSELLYTDMRPNFGDVGTFTELIPNSMTHSNTAGWNTLLVDDNEVVCHENSANQEYQSDAYSRGRTLGLLTSSFLSGLPER